MFCWKAAATGLALVATDIGGNRDIIDDGITGFLVPVKNFIVLASKIKDLVENEDIRSNFGYEATRKVMQKFSLKNVANLYFEIYNEIYNNKYCKKNYFKKM